MNLLNTPLLAATFTLLAWSAEGRSFTNLAGVKIEAEIVSKQGDQVRIKRADGREFTLQVNSLSPADQDYIKTWQPPAAPAPVKPGAPAAPVPVSADPRVKPGAVVALEFPDLAKDRLGNTATCNVRIPEDYDPAKPVPLLVWLGGGDGTNQPGGGFALVDKAHWAVAALPYPTGTTPQGKTLDDQKNFTVIFNYQKTMLEELVKLLPNLDPKIRVVAGFSNGAHTIGTNIMRGEKEFTELFNAYILIEGGCNAPKAKKKLRGKYAYLAWDDPRSTPFMLQGAAGAAKAAGMTATEHRMPNSGHAFPDTEKALVKEWIEKTVIPGLNAPPKK